MAPTNPHQKTAESISNAVIFNHEALPEADQFEDCTPVDIASALHRAAKTYTSKAEAITSRFTPAESGEDDSGANEAIKFILAWWKQVAARDFASMASNGDRDSMIGSLLACLDNIKDLEWEVL